MTTDLKEMYRKSVPEQFPETLSVDFGGRKVVYRKRVWRKDASLTPDGGELLGLRYGENPHQPAAFYVPPDAYGAGEIVWEKLGKGGPSWINLADIEHGMRVLRYFNRPGAVVMKHLNPAGAAWCVAGESLVDVYRAARDCDNRASYGGVVCLNFPVDEAVAVEIGRSYLEVVAAPKFEHGVRTVLGSKKDLRLARIPEPSALPKFTGEDREAPLEIRSMLDGSLLVQSPYVTRIRSVQDFISQPVVSGPQGLVKGEHLPTPPILEDLLLAWYVNTGVRSNGIVLVKNGRTLALGTGQQERIGAVEQAIAKARQKGHDLAGSVMSSDAFFPFTDAIDACAEAGVTAIVQPGGSLRDSEVLTACNQYGIAIVFTRERCFGHF